MLSNSCGTETEHCRHCARHRRATGGAEPGAAPRRYLWHRCGRRPGAAAVDRGGGWHRQNQDAGAPGGAADFGRCRPAPFVAVDVYPPRRARDDPSRPADPRFEPTRQTGSRRRGRAIALVGHISFDRQPVVAPTCRRALAGSRLHCAGPCRQRRSDGSCAQRARPRPHPIAISKEGYVFVDLFLHRECGLSA